MKGNPAGHRVLIRPDKVEKTTDSGIVIESADSLRKEQAANTTGEVLQVGHSCWWAYDKDSPDWKPWAKKGDRVIYGRFSAKVVLNPETGEELWLINDDDILYVFGDEE